MAANATATSEMEGNEGLLRHQGRSNILHAHRLRRYETGVFGETAGNFTLRRPALSAQLVNFALLRAHLVVVALLGRQSKHVVERTDLG
jgi:hypothetical protein